jgi:hypothetical protein
LEYCRIRSHPSRRRNPATVTSLDEDRQRVTRPVGGRDWIAEGDETVRGTAYLNDPGIAIVLAHRRRFTTLLPRQQHNRQRHDRRQRLDDQDPAVDRERAVDARHDDAAEEEDLHLEADRIRAGD